MFSSRHIEHDKALSAKLGANALAGTPREAAAFDEVLLMSVPCFALPEVGKQLADLITGNVVIDACNPFTWRDGETATRVLEKGASLAGAELLPGARIVRAFNAIGYARMGVAHEERGAIGMPFTSDGTGAIRIGTRLIRDIGYEPVPIGSLAMGKYLMPGTRSRVSDRRMRFEKTLIR